MNGKSLMRKIFFFLIIYTCLFAQSETTFFPNMLNIQPFTANFLEPKLGFAFALGENNLNLNIGNSRDIVHIIKNNTMLSFGADLFTYTKLSGENNFRFPVDAVDYLFGINSGYKIILRDYEIGFRLRISHISAHMVDGHFDTQTNYWKDSLAPHVYSREFLEYIPYFRYNDLRAYIGITYLFHTIPGYVGKEILQFGGDKFFANLISTGINPFVAYDFRIYKVDKFVGNNTICAGIKFGEYDKSGISILFTYYSGLSYQGEYYNTRINNTTIGINLDL
jgi:hypothetical protein